MLVKVWAWGRNTQGQLGDGSTTNRSTPVPVKGEGGEGRLEKVIAIAAAFNHSLALTSDGKVFAWGENTSGRLGDGSTTNRSTPVGVKDPGGEGRLEKVTVIAAGDHHSIALAANGRVWAWGRNSSGQLGDGSTTDRPTPGEVSELQR